MNVDELALTKLLVYGTTTPGDDPNTHIRQDNAVAPSVTFSMIDYLTTGAGRYARPSEAPLIQAFFADATATTPTLANGTYSVAQLRAALGVNSSLNFSVSNYTTDASSADFIERAYVFGGSGFSVLDSMIFNVNNGVYTIQNMEVIARPDDFDFQSGSWVGMAGNVFLTQALDPYGLIPEIGGNTTGVAINYSGSGRTYGTYTAADFANDRQFVSDSHTPLEAGVQLAAAFADLVAGTGYLGAINSDNLFRYYTDDGKKVIYGTPGDDTITEFSAELTADVYFDYRMVGGTGNDNITGGAFGDELWGGDGDDILNGKLGDDKIIGGAGNDTIEGGSFILGTFEGEDVSVYHGALSEYSIEFLPDDKVRITDADASRDGADTLTGIEFAQFSDQTISLKPGQDIAFVIDTTGSMWDDIAAVKAQSATIINAIFNGENSVLNSRIAIVGYNDPDTNTFLSFTDQPKIDDRKIAALNAINSITVGGGGDFPEMVNSGLLRALNGGAGEWREEASARRIILFGDAPPKDTDLRAQVLQLAADVGVDISGAAAPLSIASDIETTTVTDGLARTRFEVATTSATGNPIKVPVEIFTILIGNDPTTRTDFESLATATGGAFFNVANASQVVDALIKAISTPDNNAPVAHDDWATTQQALAVDVAVLGNDSDPDGDALAITGFTQGSHGVVTLSDNGTPANASDDFLVYTPNPQADPSIGFTDSFQYTISDGKNGTSTATVTVAVGKIEDGGTGKDSLIGTPGDDILRGSTGKDILAGFGGNDVLIGGNGKDILIGGAGNDKLRGGNGNDIFVFNAGEGVDVITDFDRGNDQIGLASGLVFNNNVFAQIANGETIVSANGAPLVRLIGEHTLTDADFIVFA